MPFFKFCKISDFDDTDFITKTILGKKIVVFKRDMGFEAIEASCKHQGADITKGKRDGDIFTCPRHGWAYNMRTGECVTNKSLNLRKFELKVLGDTIKVSTTPMD